MARSESRMGSEIGSGLASLDRAVEVIRRHWGGILSRYALASGPMVWAGWLWIDAVVAQDRRGLGPASLAVTVALVWRWAGLSFVQAWVMRRTGGAAAGPVWPRLWAIVLTRLYANLAIVWGGLVVLPGVWGLYGSGMAGPILIQRRRRAWAAMRELGGLMFASLGVLWRHLSAVSGLFLVVVLNTVVIQWLVVNTVLPSLVGLDTADLRLSMAGAAWWISTFFLLWLGFDLYWAVACVLLLDQLQARRTGSDLSGRLAAMEGASV